MELVKQISEDCNYCKMLRNSWHGFYDESIKCHILQGWFEHNSSAWCLHANDIKKHPYLPLLCPHVGHMCLQVWCMFQKIGKWHVKCMCMLAVRYFSKIRITYLHINILLAKIVKVTIINNIKLLVYQKE